MKEIECKRGAVGVITFLFNEVCSEDAVLCNNCEKISSFDVKLMMWMKEKLDRLANQISSSEGSDAPNAKRVFCTSLWHPGWTQWTMTNKSEHLEPPRQP